MPTANAFNDGPTTARRQRILMEGQGHYAEPFDRKAINSFTASISGTIYGSLVGLLAGDVVTNITVLCQAVAVSPTLTKVALYSKAGGQLAASVDVSASFLSTGVKTIALALQSNGLPLTIPADDVYYAAFINVAGTGASLMRGHASGFNCTAGVGSGSAPFVVQTGQADLTAPATFTATSASVAWWMGIS